MASSTHAERRRLAGREHVATGGPRVIAIFAIVASTWPGPSTGRLEGRVFIEGLPDARDSVVWLVPQGDIAGPAHPLTALLDQRGLDFEPRVLVIPVGSTVEFRNSDTVLHNIFAPATEGAGFDLGTWPAGEIRSRRFDRAEVISILCNVHPEMEAFIVVVPTRYYALVDESGTFQFGNLPPGNYLASVWHPRARTTQRAITVGTGPTTIEFALARLR